MAEEVRRFGSLNGHGKSCQLISAPDPSKGQHPSPKAGQLYVRSKSISSSVNSRSQSADSFGDPLGGLPSRRELHSQAATTGWTSFYLRKGTLTCFAVCFIVMLAALAILAYIDGNRHGLVAAQDSQHYLWTYGPTAVLAVVAALWGQVEHRTKQALPWAILRDDPSVDPSTLLMDYINPSQPETLYRALRSSHWPVVLVVAGSWMIKLLTIASTGLLVLTDTHLVQDCQLRMPSSFDTTTFNASNVGSMPALTALAVLNGSIRYPPGTSRDMAFTIPSTILSNPDVREFDVEAPVKTFSAGLNCEVAAMSSHDTFCRDKRCHTYSMQIDMDSPTCQIRNLTYTTGCNSASTDPLTCAVGDIRPVQCNSNTDKAQQQRLLVAVTRVFQNVSAYGQTVKIVSNETTSLLCVPTYNISNALVRVDHKGSLLDVTAHVSGSTQSFPGWDVLDGIYMSAYATGDVLGFPFTYTGTPGDPWLQMWKLFDVWANDTMTIDDMNDPTTLRETSDEFFGILSAQLAQKYLVSTTSVDREGVCYTVEPRLHVRALSLYLMTALLILLTISAISLVLVAPRNVTSQDPGSIGSIALILAADESLAHRISELHVSAPNRSSLQLQEASRYRDAAEPKWWNPLSLKQAFKAFVVIMLFLMILTLELLLWKSRSNDGLDYVDPQGYVRYAWAYVPAAAMVGVQLLVGMLVFSSILVFPYYNLRVGTSNTCADLLRDYASKTAFQSFWMSALNRHMPVLFVTLAMLLMPLLTVVVSGLYTAQTVKIHHKVSLETWSQFNTSFQPQDLTSTDWRQSTRETGLLFTENISYPTWTYKDLAFPEFRLQVPSAVNTIPQQYGNEPTNVTQSVPALQGNISANIPAIRANLACKDVPVNGAPAFFASNLMNDTVYAAVSNFTAFRDIDCGYSWPAPDRNAFGFFTQGAHHTFCGAYGSNSQHWRAFTCDGTLQMVDVDVVFDASTSSILEAVTNEASTRTVSNYSIRSEISSDLSDFPADMIPSIYGSATTAIGFPNFFDPPFQAILHDILPALKSPGDFPIQDYMTDDGFGAFTISLNHVYRTVQAQGANIALRVPLDSRAPFAPPAEIDATMTGVNGYRLVQSSISTRILDGLLAAIAVCVALSAWLMNTAQILPRNPTSIAGAASLVTESTILLRAATTLDEAGFGDTGKADRVKRSWNGMHFSLGWWNLGIVRSDEKGQRRFGIDFGQAERY